MTELKIRLYQAFFNPSHPCRGRTTKSLLENLISVTLPFFLLLLIINIPTYAPYRCINKKNEQINTIVKQLVFARSFSKSIDIYLMYVNTNQQVPIV